MLRAKPFQLMPSARGICFWYQAVDVARAEASCRYRIGHFVEVTTGADVVIGETLPRVVASRAKVVVCIRPFVTPVFARAVSRLQRDNVEVVADYDDLLFAGNASGLPASAGGTGGDPSRLQRYAAGLELFGRYTVSTRALARRLQKLVPDATVHVVPNALSSSWVAQGRALYRAFAPADAKLIRYFPGSPSHDQDFASIAGPLCSFLQRNPQVSLEVVGLLRFDQDQFPRGQVRHRPRVHYDLLPELLASSWVNLSPLAASEFSECKSAIKFLEAGAFGCPTLASPNDDLLRHVEQGAQPCVCAEPQAWPEQLASLLEPSTRARLGQDARGYVDHAGLVESQRDAWLRALRVGQA